MKVFLWPLKYWNRIAFVHWNRNGKLTFHIVISSMQKNDLLFFLLQMTGRRHLPLIKFDVLSHKSINRILIEHQSFYFQLIERTTLKWVIFLISTAWKIESIQKLFGALIDLLCYQKRLQKNVRQVFNKTKHCVTLATFTPGLLIPLKTFLLSLCATNFFII